MPDVVEQYLEHRRRTGLAQRTIQNDRMVLRTLRGFLQKPIEEATEADLLAYLDARQLSPRTEKQRRFKLSLFYRWLGRPIQLPKLRVPHNLPVQPSDLVSEEDVQKLIHAFDHPRNKALVAVTYESAARAHEVLGLRFKDITFEGTHARIRVKGKTGERIIPVVWSSVYLQQWLNYVGRLKPEDIIWRTPRGSICYSWFTQLLGKHSQEVLGRKINAHLLRHSRITYLVKHPQISTAVVCEFAGWKQGSQILQTYIHLAGADVEQAVLAIHGKTPSVQMEAPTEPIVCVRCGTENPPEARFCSQCSLILDEAEAHRIMDRDEQIDEFIAFLVDHPDIVNKLKKRMWTERKSKKKENEM